MSTRFCYRCLCFTAVFVSMLAVAITCPGVGHGRPMAAVPSGTGPGGPCGPVDAVTYLVRQRLGTQAFAEVEAHLAAAFDRAHADGAWATEVDNWTSLRWRCAVGGCSGALLSCLWVFAGSKELPLAAGGWQTTAWVARCTVPASGDLLATLAHLRRRAAMADLMVTPWPGQTAGLEDVLTACFARSQALSD